MRTLLVVRVVWIIRHDASWVRHMPDVIPLDELERKAMREHAGAVSGLRDLCILPGTGHDMFHAAADQWNPRFLDAV